MNEILRRLMKLQRRIRARRYLPAGQWLDFFMDWNIWPSDVALGSDGRLAMPLLGIEVDYAHRSFVLGYKSVADTSQFSNIKFSTTAEGDIIAEINGVRVNIGEAVELATLFEIYIDTIYGCTLPPDTIVIDVGMNVGLASLWFAAMPNVHRVYGFEPFTPTYRRLLLNLGLNPTLANKIEANNYGLDSVDRELSLDYSDAKNASVGVYATNAKHREWKVVKQSVQMRAVAPVISRIRAEHPGKPLFMKLDCEGSEYDIIPSMEYVGLINELSGLVMETHRVDINPLLDPLSRHFQYVFYNYKEPPNIAMFYAAGSRSLCEPTGSVGFVNAV